MKRGKKGFLLWLGRILLSLSLVVWVALISAARISPPGDFWTIMLGGLIITTIPIAASVLLIWSTSRPVTAVLQDKKTRQVKSDVSAKFPVPPSKQEPGWR